MQQANNLTTLAEQLGQQLLQKQLMLVSAESCTGGWIAEAITAIPGSSKWFERGYVTYSNAAKQELLGVTEKTLQQHGAVSEQTAEAMAAGALQHSHAQVSVATTGIAGPDGGSVEKPVGLVWLGFASHNVFSDFTIAKQFNGDRYTVREQAVSFALQTLSSVLTI